ncbi:hypothetical protein WBO78_21545 [Bosea sp. CCNWLW174]|uniref:hypothetical protein n=1 Tax=unclassified Bosea (in: a-proteobacteria) TaxID=2653178 RepID=UPI00301552AB
MTLPARFRSLDRDRETDLDRLGPLYRHLEQALAGIERESAGLSRRLDEARTRAAALLGNEDGIYFEREPADEARLVEAEAQMMAAFRRLEQLRAQRSMLAAWRTEIEDTGIGGALRGGTRASRWLSRLVRLVRARMAAIRRLSRFSGWALMLVIVYATLSGIEQRPSVSWLIPDLERGLAFLAAAAAFAIGYPRQRFLIFAVGLAAVISLELAQNWSPTRHGTIHDVWIKAIGLGLGFALVSGVERLKPSARSS